MSNTLLDDIIEVGKEGTYDVLWVYFQINDLLLTLNKPEWPENDLIKMK